MIWTGDKIKHHTAGLYMGYTYFPVQLWLLATRYDHASTYYFILYAALFAVISAASKELYDWICSKLLALKQSPDFTKLPQWQQSAINWVSNHINLNHKAELDDFKATMIGFKDGLLIKDKK